MRPSGGRASGIAGAVVVAIMFLACLGSLPWTLAPVSVAGTGAAPTPTGAQPRRFEARDLQAPFSPPSTGHLLGTDRLGRDLFVRSLAGGGISLAIGLAAAFVAVSIGTLYGAIAGYAGGRTDAIMMRIVDVLYGLPNVLLVVLLAVAVDGLIDRGGGHLAPGTRQVLNVATLLVAIGSVTWLTMARVIRGQVLSLKQQPFMEACRCAGVPLPRQFFVHLLPNLIGPIVVYATLSVPAAILSESFLSFLGIGVQEPLPSWGNLAAAGLDELNTVHSRWWLLVWPCALVAVTLLALNFVGEWLRVAFDPRHGAGVTP